MADLKQHVAIGKEVVAVLLNLGDRGSTVHIVFTPLACGIKLAWLSVESRDRTAYRCDLG